MERSGKGLAAGETERDCVRDGESLKMELASVLKWPLEGGLTIMGFRENLT